MATDKIEGYLFCIFGTCLDHKARLTISIEYLKRCYFTYCVPIIKTTERVVPGLFVNKIYEFNLVVNASYEYAVSTIFYRSIFLGKENSFFRTVYPRSLEIIYIHIYMAIWDAIVGSDFLRI